MSIYKKLQEGRILLQNTKLKKSGHNSYAGYNYFELGDFLPEIQNICAKIGLCGVVSFNHEMAYLQLTDVEDGTSIMFTSPMSSAALKGCHDVQNLGAVQTYLRRYLWVNAFEIVEHDALEPLTAKPEPKTEPKKAEPKPKAEKKAEVKEEPKEEFFNDSMPWQVSVDTSSDTWPIALKEGLITLLQVAKSVDDIHAIYRVNTQLLDKLKTKDEDAFNEVFEVLKQNKESMKGMV